MRSAFIVSGLLSAGLIGCVLSGGAAAKTDFQVPGSQPGPYHGAALVANASEAHFDIFLDRLMMAESNGRSHAKNPRSSALGPFQFINSTWFAVLRKHFPDELENKSQRQILAMRTDHDMARRAAEAFSKDNADYLAERGIEPTFGHLRLAFLLGAGGAAKVLEAPPKRPVKRILGENVVRANPFMRRMSAADLIARATRDVEPEQQFADAKPSAPEDEAPSARPETAETPTLVSGPRRIREADLDAARSDERVSVINVRCSSRVASCKRWIDEQVARVIRVSAGTSIATGPRNGA